MLSNLYSKLKRGLDYVSTLLTTKISQELYLIHRKEIYERLVYLNEISKVVSPEYAYIELRHIKQLAKEYEVDIEPLLALVHKSNLNNIKSIR